MDWSWEMPYAARRGPLLARNAVATSQSLASQAGAAVLAKGGNAVDAALAAATTLTVVEPTMNGIGGDLFAILWDGKQMHALNSSGRAPAVWSRDWILARHPGATRMPRIGWDSVSVPGVVAGWVALSERFGKLPFADCFESAIRYARDGHAVTPIISRQWRTYVESLGDQPGFREFMPFGREPRPGERWQMPAQAETLEDIARTRGESFYRGRLAARIAGFSRECGAGLTEADLAAHQADWVSTIEQEYRGHHVHEIPPNGQGIAALMALGIVSHLPVTQTRPDTAERLHLQIEAMRLAFADAHAYVSDPTTMRVSPAQMLDPDYLAQRARLVDPRRMSDFGPGQLPSGGTVYLCAADASGMMISLIQSNYTGFGSGVVVPGTGIALQNRGSGFSLVAGHPNEVAGGKRPLHTILPGFLSRNGQPVGPFGVMGGNMQPQGHLQVVMRLLDDGVNPQAALDGPRWRLADDGNLMLEPSVGAEVAQALKQMGHPVVMAPAGSLDFGSGQMIVRLSEDLEDGYCAGSEHRRDGQAVGF